jgi:hypothetical protein
MNSWLDWSTESAGGDAISEAARKAPAQAELRPTCTGVSRVILPCDVTPHEFLARLVDKIRNAISEAARKTPVKTAELRPTWPGASSYRSPTVSRHRLSTNSA